MDEFSRHRAGSDVVPRAAEAEIVVVNKVRIGAAQIAALPKLRLIAIAATGYDNVDLDAARAAGIAVTNIRGYSTDSVPEHTFALILALQRQILPYVADVRAGAWQASGQFCLPHPQDLRSARQEARPVRLRRARPARGAACRRLRHGGVFSPAARARRAGQERWISTRFWRPADILSLHCPLNAETQNMIGWPEFGAMRKKPLLINTARGGLVDEEALERALDAGLVAGRGHRRDASRAAARRQRHHAAGAAAQCDRDAACRLGQRRIPADVWPTSSARC